MADEEEGDRLIEGVGNELVWAFGFLLATALFIFYLLIRGRANEVHPQQVTNEILIIKCSLSLVRKKLWREQDSN